MKLFIKILILGKGVAGKGVHDFLEMHEIEHDYLNISEVDKLDYQIIVKSPGISYQESIIKKAIAKKILVITDIELIYLLSKNYIIGITGTNGKTTTTTLLTEILSKKYKSIACGNIGYSIARASMDHSEKTIFITELSSFQLSGIHKFRPQIAIILNLGVAHQDYHESIEEYHQAKLNIARNLTRREWLIYNYDDKTLCSYITQFKTRKISLSIKSNKATYYYKDNGIYLQNRLIMRLDKLKLQGEHNKYNILAAVAAARLKKVSIRKIKKVVCNFTGVKYRLEHLGNNIYNDAKSTNPNATIAALSAFKGNILLICGGLNRHENLAVLDGHLNKIKKVYAYGETKELILKYMEERQIDAEVFNTLNDAAIKALIEKGTEDTILYSPMMASHDQFTNYEERGNLFYDIIKKAS